MSMRVVFATLLLPLLVADDAEAGAPSWRCSLMTDVKRCAVQSNMLLQTNATIVQGRSFLQRFGGGIALEDEPSAGHESCTEIDNHGTYFSVPLLWGSGQEKVDVIVDTGSNTLVVTDCYCGSSCRVSDGMCVVPDLSSSYDLHCQKNASSEGTPQIATIMYGSGAIAGYIAEDTVTVGTLTLTAKMLVVQVSYLNIATPFQGILGLGLPLNKTELEQMSVQASAEAGGSGESSQIQRHPGVPETEASRKLRRPNLRAPARADAVEQVAGESEIPGLPDTDWVRDDVTCGTTIAMDSTSIEASAEGAGYVDGLLEQSNAQRFSMCFNDGTTPGVLRINQPKADPQDTLENIGFFHWGLGLHGITVAGEKLANLCTEQTGNMSSPCGLIPDSGTTLITAPASLIFELKASICDRWTACAAVSSQYPGITTEERAKVFDLLLTSCGDLMNDTATIDDILPPIEFIASGPDPNRTLNLKLPPWAYILESIQHDVLTGETFTSCEAMFGVMEYETVNNGPIWILGTSLFYQYTVGFEYDPVQPAISFTPRTVSPCGSCGMALTAMDGEQRAQQRRPLRQKRGEPLYPRVDTTQPL